MDPRRGRCLGVCAQAVQTRWRGEHDVPYPLHSTAAEEASMETIVGIALVVISALEILWVVRVVSANLTSR